jgi:hypothetical protein
LLLQGLRLFPEIIQLTSYRITNRPSHITAFYLFNFFDKLRDILRLLIVHSMLQVDLIEYLLVSNSVSQIKQIRFTITFSRLLQA